MVHRHIALLLPSQLNQRDDRAVDRAQSAARSHAVEEPHRETDNRVMKRFACGHLALGRPSRSDSRHSAPPDPMLFRFRFTSHACLNSASRSRVLQTNFSRTSTCPEAETTVLAGRFPVVAKRDLKLLREILERI